MASAACWRAGLLPLVQNESGLLLACWPVVFVAQLRRPLCEQAGLSAWLLKGCVCLVIWSFRLAVHVSVLTEAQSLL